MLRCSHTCPQTSSAQHICQPAGTVIILLLYILTARKLYQHNTRVSLQTLGECYIIIIIIIIIIIMEFRIIYIYGTVREARQPSSTAIHLTEYHEHNTPLNSISTTRASSKRYRHTPR
jgi:uncharacterized membrane protein YcjF (UPF0283 family)